VRNPSALQIERRGRQPVGIDHVTLEHDRLVARTRQRERGGKPRDTAAGNHKLHRRTLPAASGPGVRAR
jgi:hypothetical protein